MGRWGSLQKLDLFNNQIGDAGMKAFSDAIAMGALPALKELYVFVIWETKHLPQEHLLIAFNECDDWNVMSAEYINHMKCNHRAVNWN